MHLKSRTKVITSLKWCNLSESGQFEIDQKQFVIFAHGNNNRLTIGLEMKSGGHLSARFDAFITDCDSKNVYYLKNSDLINFHECIQTRQNLFTINELLTQKYNLCHEHTNCITVGLILVFNHGTPICNYFQRSLSYSKKFNDRDVSDFQIVCGQREFFVSKLILSSRSDVFDTMFANQSVEPQTKQLVIDDMDEEIMEEFLKYLYYGYSDKLDEFKEELLSVAHKYGVTDLKTICENLLFVEINIRNAITLLLTFDKYSCSTMVTNSVEFIAKNFTKIRTEVETQWKALLDNHYSLADTIILFMADQMQKASIYCSRTPRTFTYYYTEE